MRKCDEKANGASCWNKATDEETVFVLLGRDASAPAAIRAWCNHRVRAGKNNVEDDQIQEALKCAQVMEDGS